MTTLDFILTQIMERLDPEWVEQHMYLSAIWLRFKELNLHHTEIYLLLAESDVEYLKKIQSWLRTELGWYWLGWSYRSRKLWQVDEDLTNLIQMLSY